MKKILLIMAILLCREALSTQPVIDTANLAEMANHISEMQKHYKKLEEQYIHMQKEYEAITGSNDYSEIFKLLDKNGNDFWAWSTDTEDLNKMTVNNQGNANAELYKQIKHYNEIYGLSGDQKKYVPHNPESYNAVLQVQQDLAARQGLSISDVLFDRTYQYDKEQINKLELQGYLLEDPKESLDYANTLQLELIKLFNDMLKLQTKQLQLMSLNQVETSVHNDFNAKFFKTNFNEDQ